MKNSIESIWQHGFLDSNALLAPKIHDLYNQKSISLVAQFEQKFRLNQFALVLAALLVSLVFVFWDMAFFGFCFASMLVGLMFVGIRQLNGLQHLDKSASSYTYVTEFAAWYQTCVDQYIIIYRVFYPVLFILGIGSYLFTEAGAQTFHAINQFSSVLGHPLTLGTGILLVTAFLSVGGERLYRADMNLAYGRELQQLHDLIAEMDVLRSE